MSDNPNPVLIAKTPNNIVVARGRIVGVRTVVEIAIEAPGIEGDITWVPAEWVFDPTQLPRNRSSKEEGE